MDQKKAEKIYNLLRQLNPIDDNDASMLCLSYIQAVLSSAPNDIALQRAKDYIINAIKNTYRDSEMTQ